MVTIEHTIEELNAILAALGERPFKEVANLIIKIKNTAEAQLAAASSGPTAPASDTSEAAACPDAPAQ
jgi:hypothetical protein